MDPVVWSPGSRALACTSFGFWMRAVVLGSSGALVRVRYVDDDAPAWLPKLSGIVGDETQSVSPERLAVLPDRAPSALPDAGASVLALWDRKRFHKGVVVRHEGTRAVVRFDEGDEHAFEAGELLPCGEPIAAEAAALRARGLEVGKAVRTLDASGNRADGWVSEVGSGRVFVRYSGVSWGLWIAPERVTHGGAGRRVEPPATDAPPGPGARARVRWVDREIYDATVLAAAADGARVDVRYDDGTEGTVPRGRVAIVRAAPPRVPQASDPVALPPWVAGVPALAELGGEWTAGTVIATRGAQVFLALGDERRIWTWGAQIAGRPRDPERFPARGTRVVVEVVQERKSRRGRVTTSIERRAGRAAGVLGDRLTVRFGSDEEGAFTREQLWQRGEPVRGTLALEATEADVEREPDAWEPASIEGTTSDGLVRVRFTRDRKRASVDRVRVRVRPPEPAAPAPEPEPVRVEPAAPEPARIADDATITLLRAIAERWSDAGYRGDALARMRVDDTSISLPVEAGTLLVRAAHDVVDITADAGEAGVLPPTDAPLVRFAGWLQRWLGGPAGESRAARDRAWACELCARDDVSAHRAGGALTLRVPLAVAPAGPSDLDAADVVRFARAVQARITSE